MKFKPIALVVIGILLGSIITLTFTRPSTSTAEILACTNKKSGKVRLTNAGECNIQTESESSVTDLWGLQSTTVPQVQSTSTTTTTLRKKYVVDAKGQTLGLLFATEGRTALWVLSTTGRWRLSTENNEVSGYMNPAGTLEGPIFSDAQCSLPLLKLGEGTNLKLERAVAEVMTVKDGLASTIRRAFQPIGRAIELPQVIYGFGYEDNQLKCIPEQESSIVGKKPFLVVKSRAVKAPSYSLPFSIVEK
jgi:hypothetical protein